MIKEFIFISSDNSIKFVHIGVFPARGRYFRKAMTPDGGGIFRAAINVSSGEVYFHYFINGDFSQAYSPYTGELVSTHDPLKRSSFTIETEPFCALEFDMGRRFIFPANEDTWILRAISHHSWIESVSLISNHLKEIPFTLQYRNKNKKYWQLGMHKDHSLTSFVIKIKGNKQEAFLHKNNDFKDMPVKGEFFEFPQKPSAQKARCLLPYSVGYQIFPDRFFKSPGQKDRDYFSRWGAEPGHYSYFGGDLPGIAGKLTYLKDLGVHFLYLNPIVHAKTSHRYDTIDYYRIDPILGSDKDLRHLVEKAHALNIKIILDISLNHCSIDFFAFKDILVNQEKSQYSDWFHLHDYPVRVNDPPQYDSWNGNKDMPEFNLENPQVQDYLIDATLYWIKKFDIDGWRLDVCASLPPSFIDKFVREIRAIKPDILIIGEIWGKNADDLLEQGWLDGITNYSLYWEVIIPLFEKAAYSLDRVADTMMSLNYRYSFLDSRYSWNFLSNHDLPRLFSIMPNKQVYQLAIHLLYALPGNPLIYYGEEVCLEGHCDPANRKCMDWHGVYTNHALISVYKSLNHMRNTYKDIFNEGNLSIPYVDNKNNILIIARSNQGISILFIFNFSRETRRINLGKILNKHKFTDINKGISQDSIIQLEDFEVKILLSPHEQK